MTCNRSLTCLGERGHDYDCETVTEAVWLKARVAELEAGIQRLIRANEGLERTDIAWRDLKRLVADSVSKPLTGAELAERHGFEPIPDWKKDPFVRPMRIESSSAPATPAKGCADPASPATGAPPEGEVTATAASKLGSRDGGERPAPISCIKCGQVDDHLDPDTGACYGCDQVDLEQRASEADREIDRLVASKTSEGRPMHSRSDKASTLGTSVTQEDRERARDLYERCFGHDRIRVTAEMARALALHRARAEYLRPETAPPHLEEGDRVRWRSATVDMGIGTVKQVHRRVAVLWDGMGHSVDYAEEHLELYRAATVTGGEGT